MVGLKRQMDTMDIEDRYERESLFWRCKTCKAQNLSEHSEVEPWLNMTKVNSENKVIIIPRMSDQEDTTVTETCSHVLLPSFLVGMC